MAPARKHSPALTRCLVFALLATGLGCSSDGGTATVDVDGLRFILQPGTTGAGVPATVSVELISESGERLTSATNQVSLTATGATLGGTTSVDAVAGLATFNGVTVNSIGQNIVLVAHTGDLTASSNTFNVVAGPANASQSTMTATPSSPIANANATLTFAVRDAFGNAIVGANATFSANAAGVTFTPPSANTDASGSVSTVFRSQNSGAVAISVNVGGTTITLPTPITVAAGAGALRFVTQPSNVAAGQTFTVSVEVVDNAGQRLPAATNQISLTLDAASLLGTTSLNAVAGLATFTGLSIPSPANGARITATSGTLTVQSNSFNIIASACVPGTMTLGTAVNAVIGAVGGCVLNGHPAASFRFSIPAGNASVVTLGATPGGSLTPEMAFTTDPAGADVIVFVPSPQASVQEWLLAPGSYLASVSATSGATGAFTINTTNNGAGAPGCTLRNLVSVSATYVGQSLAAGSPTDCNDPAGAYYEDRFRIFDSRPCTIKMSAAFDAYMQLRDLNNNVITDDDDGGGGRDAQISRTSCRNGANPYMIAASSFNELDTGPYTLTITFTAAAPGQFSETITLAPRRAATMADVFRGRVKR